MPDASAPGAILMDWNVRMLSFFLPSLELLELEFSGPSLIVGHHVIKVHVVFSRIVFSVGGQGGGQTPGGDGQGARRPVQGARSPVQGARRPSQAPSGQ